ncbi:MAG: helix-turn-helix domain-containing protein [Terriglobia bacterium]|nr:helix-turn-helix domain-containing protein [Terriglobia bacterium]
MNTTNAGIDMQDELKAITYRIEEAAQLLGIGRNTAYEAARTGQLPTVRIGKRLLVPKVALDKLLNGTA